MNPDPFENVRINKIAEVKKTANILPTENENPESEQKDIFSKVRIANPDSQEESMPQYIARNATRIASRVAETIGGTPGDISDLIQSGVFSGLETLTGKPASQETREKARLKSNAPPSSNQLQELSESNSKGYTSPKNDREKIIDEYSKTAASLLGPMKWQKALGIAALGTGVKKGAEFLGFEEGTQEAAKLGTMLISSMINPTGVKNLSTNLYNQAEKLAPEGTLVSAGPLKIKLERLIKDLKKGTLDKTEEKLLEQTKRVLKKIKKGKVDVNHMIASQRSINGIAGDPEFFQRAEHLFPRLQKAVKGTIKLHKDSEFLKTWHNANNAFSGLAQSQKTSKFIQKHLGSMPIKHAFLASLGEAAAGYPEAILPTLGGSFAAMGGVKSYELLHRIMKSPVLREYYGEVIKNALKENSNAMIKSAEKLDRELNRHKGKRQSF
jgi:hypothetical protein